ncbi:MAG: transcription termination/antitermination factor NusG [Candidatus Saganbacteria bacterium]|nr:transcription termination/antitermination factor NusG [Candidatus Saganbacteria bacterium]
MNMDDAAKLENAGEQPEAVPAGAAQELTAEGPATEELKAEEPKPEEPKKVEAEAPKKAEEPKAAGERRWFVVQTFTGQEDKAKAALEQTIRDEGLENKVFQVLVPLEETVEIKGGKRVEKIRKMFPGYVFLEMVLDEQTWYLIRQTTGVARFIGSKVSPTPVSDKEMQRVLKQLGKEEKLEVNFERGEAVRVISGAFRGYTGTVDDINGEKGKLKVLINIFGRDTPVEVNFEHAQKIN